MAMGGWAPCGAPGDVRRIATRHIAARGEAWRGVELADSSRPGYVAQALSSADEAGSSNTRPPYARAAAAP